MTGGYRRRQRVTGRDRKLQLVTGGYQGYKRIQKVTRDYRG